MGAENKQINFSSFSLTNILNKISIDFIFCQGKKLFRHIIIGTSFKFQFFTQIYWIQMRLCTCVNECKENLNVSDIEMIQKKTEQFLHKTPLNATFFSLIWERHIRDRLENESEKIFTLSRIWYLHTDILLPWFFFALKVKIWGGKTR